MEKIFSSSTSDLKGMGFRTDQITSLKNSKIDREFVNSEMEKIKKYNIDIIVYEDERYPEILKEIKSPPCYLYAYGKTECLEKPSIAVVGARKSSTKAKEFSRDLAGELAALGFNIVSGFAEGIDINAHLGAVEKGETTAVFGNGLLKLYPGKNKLYVNEIMEKGCLLSEYSLDEEPLAVNFPKRNRIISGLCLGVVIVEASEKSGSLITAKYALENGREVFAVPAWPENHNSATNKLIKNGAKLTENYMDVVEEFARIVNFPKMVDNESDGYNISFDSADEKCIYNILITEPMTIDEICMKTAIDASSVLTLVSGMEIKGIVHSEVDGRYSIRRN